MKKKKQKKKSNSRRHKTLGVNSRQSSSSEALAVTSTIIIPVANIFFLRKPAVHMRLIIIYFKFPEFSMHRGTYNQPNQTVFSFSWLLSRLSQCPFSSREPVDLDISQPTLHYSSSMPRLYYNFYLSIPFDLNQHIRH